MPDRGVPHVPVTPGQRGRQGHMHRPIPGAHCTVRRRRALLPPLAATHLPLGKHSGVHTARAPGHPGVLWHRLVADVQKQRFNDLKFSNF